MRDILYVLMNAILYLVRFFFSVRETGTKIHKTGRIRKGFLVIVILNRVIL